jgi:hypothetical protein
MTSGTVTNGTFYARGNLASFNGTLMDCPVDAICGYIRLSGSTFNETADFTDLGTATGTGVVDVLLTTMSPLPTLELLLILP